MGQNDQNNCYAPSPNAVGPSPQETKERRSGFSRMGCELATHSEVEVAGEVGFEPTNGRVKVC